MSGVYCDGCWEGNLIPDPGGAGQEPVVCDLCSWRADFRTLCSLSVDGEEEPWTKRERKKAGKLFFLWIHFDPAKKSDAVSRVMGILGLDGMNSRDEALVELEAIPAEDALRRIAAVDGVTKVWLAP